VELQARYEAVVEAIEKGLKHRAVLV